MIVFFVATTTNNSFVRIPVCFHFTQGYPCYFAMPQEVIKEVEETESK